MSWITVKTLFTILILLLLPGWAILAGTGYWRKWNPLQRWFLAICLGVSFWPIFYYSTRTLIPSLRIGTNKLIIILAFFAVIIFIQLRKNWKEQLKFGENAGIVILVLMITLLSRLIVAYEFPYLAGDDSLHHSLITNLVATTGRLPYNILPFDSTNLNHYHLGLYALTGPLQLLVGISAPQALLWFSQFLNGLCGLGIFLMLDRKVSREAGIFGMISVGLFSIFPSWFINWGRFTQLAAQTVLLPAALLAWETISTHNSQRKILERQDWVDLILAGLLFAGVCLLHFRVAVFLLGLILIICLSETIKTDKRVRIFLRMATRVVVLGLIVLIIVLPTLISGLESYLVQRDPQSLTNELNLSLTEQSYYIQGDKDTWKLTWKSASFLVIGGLGMVVGLFSNKTRRLSLIIFFWFVLMIVLSQLYRLNIPALAFVNITAVLLAFYLPFGIGAGILWQILFEKPNRLILKKLRLLAIGMIVFASFFTFYLRTNDFLEVRAFMTPEDEAAMEWVKLNTDSEAVFGVNTAFLNPAMPYGTDAGYWLPVYAERRTTTMTLLASLSDDYSHDLERSKTMTDLYKMNTVETLCDFGVDYLYSGVKNPLGSQDFVMIQGFEDISNVGKVYDKHGIQIFKICDN